MIKTKDIDEQIEKLDIKLDEIWHSLKFKVNEYRALKEKVNSLIEERNKLYD